MNFNCICGQNLHLKTPPKKILKIKCPKCGFTNILNLSIGENSYIEWDKLVWDNFDQNPIKVYRNSHEPVSGTVIKRGFSNKNSTLLISFYKGEEQGEFEIVHKDDANKSITRGKFRHGELISKLTTYYPDGETLYSEGSGKYFRYQYDSFVKETVDDVRIILEGKVQFYTKEGELSKVSDIKRMSGKVLKDVDHYLNGEVVKSYQLKNDKKNGIEITNFDDGSKKTCEFKNDKPHGLCREYYPNGNIKYEGRYTFGSKDGDWKYYDESGNIENSSVEEKVNKTNTEITDRIKFEKELKEINEIEIEHERIKKEEERKGYINIILSLFVGYGIPVDP